MIASKFLPNGMIDSGIFAGLSVLAIVASMNDTNNWFIYGFDGPVWQKKT